MPKLPLKSNPFGSLTLDLLRLVMPHLPQQSRMNRTKE